MTTAVERTGYQITKQEKRFIGWHILVAVISILIGSLFGPLQALEFSGLDLYQYLDPVFESFSLAELMQDVAQEFELEGQRRGVAVTVEAARDESRDRAAATTAPTMSEAQRFEHRRVRACR